MTVYNLPMPAWSVDDDWGLVARTSSSQRQAVLATVESSVLAACAQYDTEARAKRSLTSITALPLSDVQRGVLKGNFNKLDTGKSCQELRDKIIATVQDGLCPYCRLHDATTLDHILEKDDYPEFSTFRQNLAPVCERCNTNKQRYKHSLSHLGAFSIYYQGYPVVPFLQAAIRVDGSHVDIAFSLVQPAGVPLTWFQALEKHFKGLDLARRYSYRGRSELRDRGLEMKRLLRTVGGKRAVSRYLMRDAKTRSANWSDQDWLPTLLVAAARSKAFCQGGFAYL